MRTWKGCNKRLDSCISNKFNWYELGFISFLFPFFVYFDKYETNNIISHFCSRLSWNYGLYDIGCTRKVKVSVLGNGYGGSIKVNMVLVHHWLWDDDRISVACIIIWYFSACLSPLILVLYLSVRYVFCWNIAIEVFHGRNVHWKFFAEHNNPWWWERTTKSVWYYFPLAMEMWAGNFGFPYITSYENWKRLPEFWKFSYRLWRKR